MSSGTKTLRFRHRENGQTWILISINRITTKVGSGIPASRFRHESTVLLAFGTANCRFHITILTLVRQPLATYFVLLYLSAMIHALTDRTYHGRFNLPIYSMSRILLD